MHSNGIVVAATLFGDFALAMLTYCFFTLYVRKLQFDELQLHTSLMVAVIYLACIINGGVILYRREVKRFQIVLLVLRNVLLFALITVPLLRIGHFCMMPISMVPVFLLCVSVVVGTFRLAVRSMMNLYRKSMNHVNKVVFLGSKSNILSLYHEMREITSLGYKVEGYFDDAPNPKFPADCPYLGSVAAVEEYLLVHPDVRELFCCLPSRRAEEILQVIRLCDKRMVHFYSVPNVTNYLHHRVYFNMLGSVPYLSLYNDPLMRPENRVKKRLFDIAVSGLFLVTLFPIILVVVTIITKLTMPGPVFFRQKRSGLQGKDFYCYKFRSMKVNADADKLQATKDDPRKTKWGDIMRKTNIDELPQFWNVLKGDMSIVGPRPHMLKHTEEYSQLIGKYMVRHFVKPGITGWSQVTGFRGETRQLSQMEGRVMGDIWYIEHWSMGLDLYIMYRTVVNALHGDKAAY